MTRPISPRELQRTVLLQAGAALTAAPCMPAAQRVQPASWLHATCWLHCEAYPCSSWCCCVAAPAAARPHRCCARCAPRALICSL